MITFYFFLILSVLLGTCIVYMYGVCIQVFIEAKACMWYISVVCIHKCVEAKGQDQVFFAMIILVSWYNFLLGLPEHKLMVKKALQYVQGERGFWILKL